MLYAWVDLETTGLDKTKCSICEIACIITDDNFKTEIDVYHRIINTCEAYWQPVALAMHQETGLYDEMEESAKGEEKALEDFAKWLANHRPYNMGEYPERFNLAGSSVHFDRRFLEDQWPYDFEDMFTHRNLDVSSIKLAIRSLCGDEVANDFDNGPEGLKKTDHRALEDIRHSIGQLNHYRDQGLIGGVDQNRLGISI